VALLYWDSFDHYADAKKLYKWSSYRVDHATAIIGATGRHSTNGLAIVHTGGGYARLRRILPAAPSVITVGMALNISSLNSMVVFGLLDNTTVQVSVRVLNDGTLQFWRGDGTALLASTAPGAFPSSNVWHYLEVQTTIDNAAGDVIIRVNDSEVLSDGPFDTQASATAQVTQIQLGGTGLTIGNTLYYDDLYVCDDSGAYCNDFLGDTRVCALLPTANGIHSDFTPLVGTNWQEVDEVSPDDDTTYNASDTPTDRDTFDMDVLPGGVAGTVHAVCAVICSRKDDSGTRTLEPSVRVGGTDYDGDPVNIPSDYTYHNMYAWETNPDTAAPWLVAEVNNPLESGYELAA